GSTGAFLFVPPASSRPFFFHHPKSQNSTLRRLLCPLSMQRTACPYVHLPSPMAAVALLLDPAAIPASAPTTPKKKPAPRPPIPSAKTWPTSSPATTSPPATSAPPWPASSPPSSAAM